jgi:uncharacterized protein (TIGR02466 family)
MIRTVLKERIVSNSMIPFVIKDEVVNQKMHIEQFFPTPIGIIPIDKAVNKKILELIKIKKWNITKNGDAGNSISSDVHILDNDELSDIKKVLTDSVNEYFKEIVNPGKDIKLYITTSWLNLNKNGDLHGPHKHPNSVVSAILYIDTCEEDSISFINDRNDVFGNLKFTMGHSETKWNTSEWSTSAMVNTLVMFPSILPHHVHPRPNTCTGTRISLAFNTWFKGEMSLDVSCADQLSL